jgi:hypothetical protein
MSPLQEKIEQGRAMVLAKIDADEHETEQGKELARFFVGLVADILIHLTEPRA